MSLIREYIVKPLTRVPGWRKIRNKYLKANPICAVCGRTNKLDIHHIKDVSNYPELELNLNNLVTLCRGATKCHFLFGHLGNWKSINDSIKWDVSYFSKKIANRR